MTAGIEPGVCPICLAADCGLGFAGGRGRSITLTCEVDLPLAEAAHRADTAGLMHRYGVESLRAAGATAGNWLLAHGETDLAKLTPMAWETFLGIFHSDFAVQMRARLAPRRT